MNRQEWIGKKIALLKKQGKSNQESLIIALAAWDKMPKAQMGVQTGVSTYGIPTAEQYSYNIDTVPPLLQYPQPFPTQQTNVGVSLDLSDDESGMTNPELMPSKRQLNTNRYFNTITNNYNDEGNAINTGKIVDNRETQIYNPYGGVDLEGALSFAGQGFANKEYGNAAIGTGLSLLKGARSFIGGFATGKASKEQMESAREAQFRKNTQPVYVAQEGGEAPPQDQMQQIAQMIIQMIQQGMQPEQIMQQLIQAGIPQEQAQMLIEQVMSQQQAPQGQDDQVMQAVMQMVEQGIDPNQIMQELVKGGIPQEQAQMLIQQAMGQGQPQEQMMQEGGKATNADMMTGAYIAEDEPENANIEIEKGEYTLNAETGEVQKADGKRHTEGGIKVNLPEGSKVLSNYTKIGAKTAKEMSDKFGIKTQASDTFAQVMDKINRKIGYTDIIEQEKEQIKKVEKVTKADTGKTTKDLNLDFLGKQLQDIEKTKQEMLKDQQASFEELFAEQESREKRGDGKTILRREGGSIYNPAVLAMAKKYSLPADKVNKLMQEGGYSMYASANDEYEDPIKQSYINNRGYGNNVQNAQRTIDQNQWYFNNDDKRQSFLNAATRQGSQREVLDFQNAYNSQLQQSLGQGNLSEQERNSYYNSNAFTGQGSQGLDGKFGEFTSSRTMYTPPTVQRNPPQETITNNRRPLYKVDITAEDMSDGNRDFTNGSLNGYIQKRMDSQGGLYKEDLEYVKRATDAHNFDIERKYNNEDSKNNPKAQERYKKLKQSYKAQEIMQEGGEMQDIAQMIIQALQQGQDPNQIMQQLIGQGVPQEQAQMMIEQVMGQGQERPQMAQEGTKVKGNKAVQEYLTQWQDKPNYESSDVTSVANRFKPFFDKFGVKYTTEDLKDGQKLDALAGKLQVKLAKDFPELARDYGTRIEPTRQGLQYLVDNKSISPKDYGIGVDNVGKVKVGSYGKISDENQKKIQAIVQSLPKDKQDIFAGKNFIDNQAFFRTFDKKEIPFNNKEEYDKYLKDNEGNKIGDAYKTDKIGAYIKPVYQEDSSVNTPEATTTTNDQKKQEDTVTLEGAKFTAPPLLPEYFTLPPSALQNIFKGEMRFGEIDPTKISPEPSLVEAERQRQSVGSQAYFLPDAQRAAVLASSLGQTQMAANDAIGKAEMFNAQQQQQADQFNLQNQMKEDLTNQQLNMSFEERNLKGQAMYENNLRSYFNELNNQNATKWNYIDKRNILNQGFDNFKTSGSDVTYNSDGSVFQANRNPERGMTAEELKTYNKMLATDEAKKAIKARVA